MTWIKIDDRVRHHPKTTAAGLDVLGLWVAGLSYCNEHVTDGKIPKTSLRAVMPTEVVPMRTMKRCAKKLVEIGRWHDRGDHWEVHGYEVEQSEAMYSAVEKRREKERKKKQRQRESQPSFTQDEAEMNSTGNQPTPECESAANDSEGVGQLSPGDNTGCPGSPVPVPDPEPREEINKGAREAMTEDERAVASAVAAHPSMASLRKLSLVRSWLGSASNGARGAQDLVAVVHHVGAQADASEADGKPWSHDAIRDKVAELAPRWMNFEGREGGGARRHGKRRPQGTGTGYKLGTHALEVIS